jgi:glycosyltransferase involved in cell wall biosynthesis
MMMLKKGVLDMAAPFNFVRNVNISLCILILAFLGEKGKKKRERRFFMKIIFVIPNMTGGGTERVISLLSAEYIKRGYEVAIMQFAGYEHAYELDEKTEDFSVAPKSNGNPFVCVKRLIAMRRYFKRNPDSCIFAFCVMGAVFSVIASWGMKRYLLVAERNNPDSCNVPKLRNWAYKRADRITFQTEEGIGYFPQPIARKAVVIPNPIDAAVPERYLGSRRHRVVTVGRLHHQKNQSLLLHAFADFSKRFTDYELHIYGQGELETQLKMQAKELGIADKTVWHGFSENVKEEIVDCRMFVLSSDYEGISNSMLEALAMGIPTISTDCPIGGARIYITNGENGLLVPVGAQEALMEAMVRVAEDDELAERLSGNAVKVKEQYSVSNIAEQFLKAADLICKG